MEGKMSAIHHPAPGKSQAVTLAAGHWLEKLPVVAGVVGVLGLVASIVLGLKDYAQFAFSFHTSYLYFLSIALGGLFFVLIQHATRAGWSVVIRRFAENIMGTLPLFALLFIPMILGMHTLYHHWTDLEAVKADRFLSQKAAYLNEPFFFVRAALYFVLWFVLARVFRGQSIAQDSSGDQAHTYRLQKLSYPGIAAFAFTLTFSSFDWIMSLDPHWYSTMFGVYYFAGAVVAIYATLIVLVTLFGSDAALERVITVEHRHDLGKLLFGHIVFWTYIAFSQFFLIWYANIPEETVWFHHRMQHGWLNVTVALALGHFVIPFFFLLPRAVKRNRTLLFLGAVWMLIIHFVDIYWLVMPNFYKEEPIISLLDVTSFFAVGGLFVAVFAWLMKRSAVIPVKDPRLPESLSFENI